MGGGSKKGKKGPKKVDDATPKKDEALNLPFGTLSALLSMGIESPIIASQIQKTIEALESKRKYFVDNQVSLLLRFLLDPADETMVQARVTKEKIAAVEKKIEKAGAKSKTPTTTNGTSTPAVVEAQEVASEKVESVAVEEKKEEVVVEA